MVCDLIRRDQNGSQLTVLETRRGPLRLVVKVRPEAERAILLRFPFGVFFVVEAESAVVLAVTHLRRHPSVWQTRA